jgi:hypothetical protein
MTKNRAQPMPLSGCNIALSGTFSAGTHSVIQGQLVSLGAELAGPITNNTTHLVTKQRDYDKPSGKVKGARNRDLFIISYEWVKECLVTNSKVPEEKYMFTSPPVDVPSFIGPKTVGKTNVLPKTIGNATVKAQGNSSSIEKPAKTMVESGADVRYASDVFQGIIIDTGATTKSTAGYSQFQALKQSNPDIELELDISTKGHVTVQFGVGPGVGSASSVGTINVHTPIGEVQFHVINVNTPFILCLADMDKLQVYYDNVRDVLVTQTSEVPVVRRFGHAFLLNYSVGDL